jgi:hypothetical protein
MRVGIRTYILTWCIFVCMQCIIHILGTCIVDIHVGTISVFACHCNDDVIGCLSGSSIVCICLFVGGAISSVGARRIGFVSVGVTASAGSGWVGVISACWCITCAPVGFCALLYNVAATLFAFGTRGIHSHVIFLFALACLFCHGSCEHQRLMVVLLLLLLLLLLLCAQNVVWWKQPWHVSNVVALSVLLCM